MEQANVNQQVSVAGAFSHADDRIDVARLLICLQAHSSTGSFMVLLNQLYLYWKPTSKPLNCPNMVISTVISATTTGSEVP